jgi:hypothetical protein
MSQTVCGFLWTRTLAEPCKVDKLPDETPSARKGTDFLARCPRIYGNQLLLLYELYRDFIMLLSGDIIMDAMQHCSVQEEKYFVIFELS